MLIFLKMFVKELNMKYLPIKAIFKVGQRLRV